MDQIKNLLANNRKLVYGLLVLMLFASGCTSRVIDSNEEVPERKWTYRNRVVANFEIKDNTKKYNVYFKLRHTAEYKYANIFILAHFIDGKNKQTKRYQYKLAKNDGEWLGSGSGNVFNYTLPMLTAHQFPHTGKFSIEVEQNMRDNPLLEVSDLGILIEETEQ